MSALVQIGVDYREEKSGVPERLRAMEGIVVSTELLAIGDYIVGPGIAVERKTALDLRASIVDRRLFRQARELVQAYERVVFLIEGESLYDQDEPLRLHPNAIRGALSTLVLLGGISVLRSEDPDDSAGLLATLARHVQQGHSAPISYHASRRSTTPEETLRYLVEDLPGIGPKTADSLLAHFGTLRALFNADEIALRAVPGIGAKRAQSISELVQYRYISPEPGESEHLSEHTEDHFA